METMRERQAAVLARKVPVAPVRERERVMEAGAPARRKKFRGVSRLASGKYGAGINVPGSKKRQWLGTYAEEEVAACAYDLAAKSLHGSKAKTNFHYPPPYNLINKVTSAPGRRGPLYPVPPSPAHPAPAPFSYKAPPSEPVPFPVRPCLLDPSRLVRPAPEPQPGATITFVRSIAPKPFSIRAWVASRLVSDPVDHIAPQIHIVAPVPANSAKTCFSSTTDPPLGDSASSSIRTRLMLKTPKPFTVPPTIRTPSTSGEGFSGDNFSPSIKMPLNFASAMMPFDLGGL